MGRTYVFECEKCGYQAKVAGGRAEGLEFTVQTILCNECRELQDAVTAARLPTPALPDAGSGPNAESLLNSAPLFAELVRRLPLMVNTEWKMFDLVCSVSPSHIVRTWKDPDKCPRCGVFMERSAMPFRQWD